MSLFETLLLSIIDSK